VLKGLVPRDLILLKASFSPLLLGYYEELLPSAYTTAKYLIKGKNQVRLFHFLIPSWMISEN